MEHRFYPTDTEGHSMDCLNCGTHAYLLDDSWDDILSSSCTGKVYVEQLIENEEMVGDKDNIIIVRIPKDGFYWSTCKQYFADSEVDGWVYFKKENALFYIHRRYLLEKDEPAIDLGERLQGTELEEQLRYLEHECNMQGIRFESTSNTTS